MQDIARALKATDDERERRIRYLEDLVKDWAQVFAQPSAALQAAGVTAERNSPSAVASTLLQATAAAKHSEEQLQNARESHAEQCAELRGALTASQHAASQAHSAELTELRSQRDAALAAERARADAAQHASQEMRRALAVQVASKTDEAVQTAVQAARQQATAAEATLQRDIERLQTELQHANDTITSLQDKLQHEQTAAGTAAAEAAASAHKAAQQHEAAAATAAQELTKSKADAAKRMKDVQAHHAAMVDTQRVQLLETHGLWLAKRVSELQVLCDELQRALAARAGKGGVVSSTNTNSCVPGVPPVVAVGVHSQHPWCSDAQGSNVCMVASLQGGKGGQQPPPEVHAAKSNVHSKHSTTYWYTRPAHSAVVAAAHSKGSSSRGRGSTGSAGIPPAGDSLFHRFAASHEPTTSWCRASEQQVATGRA